MSHETAPSPIINPDGSVNEEIFTSRGVKVNLDQPISHQEGGRRFEGTVRDMLAQCSYIADMVNEVGRIDGIDEGITAFKFVGRGAGVETVVPIEDSAGRKQEAKDTQTDVKKNPIFPNLPQTI